MNMGFFKDFKDDFSQPDGQVVVAVELLCHPLQVAEVDAVAVLHHAVVVVREGGLQHSADADGTAGRRTHPDHVVVAPLDFPYLDLPKNLSPSAFADLSRASLTNHDTIILTGKQRKGKL